MVTIALGSTPIEATPKKKHSMLPFLVVLFLISYGLLALLVVEQDRTITNQRSLINQVMGDSLELTALKGKLAYQKQHPCAHSQSPSTHVNPQDQGSVKHRKLVPLKPPTDADTPDVRRTPVSI